MTFETDNRVAETSNDDSLIKAIAISQLKESE